MPHAVEYLKNVRGMTDETAARWKIGYWDYEWCSSLLNRLGITDDYIKAVGITPALHGRVIIPVTDPVGNPIGFVGRMTPPVHSNVRYLYVTSELARRRYNLFGLPFALRHTDQHGFIILVEGPFDAMLLEQVGYPAVCTHGAYLTIEQALLLKSVHLPIYVLGDGDSSGGDFLESVKRRRKYLPAENVFATTCPKGSDPAKLVQLGFSSGFSKILLSSEKI